MKKIKTLLLALVILPCLVFSLAACKDEHEHTYSSDWASDATNHWHAATCEHIDEKSDVTAHAFDGGTITTAATCTTDGVKTFTCSVCAYSKTETVAATGHSYAASEWYDSAHQYVKTKVCANDAAHKIDDIAVDVTAANIDTILNENAKTGEDWTSYNLKLANGTYEKISVESANRTTDGNGESATPYIYERTLANLVIEGTDKASTIINGFDFNEMCYQVVYKNEQPWQQVDYYKDSRCEIDTLVFKNVTFTDKIYINSIVSAYTNESYVKVKNIVLENVTFDFTGKTVDNSALHIVTADGGIDSVVVNNCTFTMASGTSNGIQIDARKADDIDVTITNSTFTDTSFNAVQLSGNGSSFDGTIVISNNTVTNTADRAFRISSLGATSSFTFTDNTMVNASDDGGELLKASVADGATVVISGNAWGAKQDTTSVKGLVNASGDNVMDSNPKN